MNEVRSTPETPELAVPDLGREIVDLRGPERIGSELRWRAKLADGTPVVVAMLSPELAADEALRRRYLRDVERLRALRVEGLAPILDVGEGPRPWRLRHDPQGETLEQWLSRRAPASVDEACSELAALADVLERVHATGAVLRDLHPRSIVRTPSGPVLTDVGLARVDLLSTRTAASLILEGSPYASPEQLRRTVLDQRSDLFGLGVIAFRALTGVLPYGDGPALFRDTSQPASSPASLVASVPASVDRIVMRCLQDDPESRPESATEFATVFRGEAPLGERALARIECQSCAARMRPGQRLCTSCGKLCVAFEHAPEGDGTHQLVLRKVSEDAQAIHGLRTFLEGVARAPFPALEFVVGDARMYSKKERERRTALPAVLFDGLTEETAKRLETRMQAAGYKAEAKSMKTRGRRWLPVAAGAAVVAAATVGVVWGAVYLAVGVGLAAIVVMGAVMLTRRNRRKKRGARPALLRLRQAPAALPASDPWVARLAVLLESDVAADVREQVGELALLVQRLVDHRLAHGTESAEIEAVTEPVEELVDLVEHHVRALVTVDIQLRTLDEARLVRALASLDPESGGEKREALLSGLDRLRRLEEQRGAAFRRLLRASELLRRSVDLGLEVTDPEREHEVRVKLALAALEA